MRRSVAGDEPSRGCRPWTWAPASRRLKTTTERSAPWLDRRWWPHPWHSGRASSHARPAIASPLRARQSLAHFMLELHGAPAFTPARLEKRLTVVRAANPEITQLSATFTHLIDLAGPL